MSESDGRLTFHFPNINRTHQKLISTIVLDTFDIFSRSNFHVMYESRYPGSVSFCGNRSISILYYSFFSLNFIGYFSFNYCHIPVPNEDISGEHEMHLLSDNIVLGHRAPRDHREPRRERRRHKSSTDHKRFVVDPGPGLGLSLGLSNVSEAQTSKIVNGDAGLHDLYSLVVNQRGRPQQPQHGGEPTMRQ